MANALYDKFREALASFSSAGLAAAIDLETDTIKAMLADAASYTPNMATNQFFSDVPAAARKGNNGNNTRADMPALAGKAVDGTGVFDANDVTFTAVPAGAALEYVILFKDTGVDATSPLICLIDTATGLPVTPGGGDVIVRWSNGANKIFKP